MKRLVGLLSATLGVLLALSVAAGTNEILNSVYDSANSALKVINYDGSAVGGTAFSDSAGLRDALSDESGTGAAIFAGGNIGPATATTPAENDNDTSVATTAFVQTEIAGITGTSVWVGSSGTGNLETATASYIPISGASNSSTEASITQAMPEVTPSEFSCILVGGSPGAGKSYTFAVRNGGSDTDWACAIADAATACTPDTSGSTIGTSARSVSIGVTPSGTPTARRGACYLKYTTS